MRRLNVVLLVMLFALLVGCATQQATPEVAPDSGEATQAPAAGTEEDTGAAEDTAAEEDTETQADEGDGEMAEMGDPYKVGVIVSVTGPGSALGVPERDTALMLAENINAAGGIEGPDGMMHEFDVIVEDDESDTGQATLSAKKLVEQDNVDMLIGSSLSQTSLAIAEVAEDAEIPLIAMGASTAIVHPLLDDMAGETVDIPGAGEHTISNGETVKHLTRLYDATAQEIIDANPDLPQNITRPWIFKTPQESYVVTQIWADYLTAKGIDKVASLGVNDAYGLDSRLGMRASFDAAGIEIVADELFQPGDTDFRSQLTNIRGTDAGALVNHDRPATGAGITSQFRELGFDIPLLHNHGVGNPVFIDLAGEAANGAMFPIGKILVAEELPDSDPQKETLLQYIDNYDTYTNGAPRSTFGGHAWDAVMIARHCLESVGPDKAALRDCFESDVKDFVGITGIFTWSPEDHTGIGTESLVLVEIVDGAFTYVAPEDYPNAPTAR